MGSESLLIEVIKFSHVTFVELKSKCLLLKSKLHRGKIRLVCFYSAIDTKMRQCQKHINQSICSKQACEQTLII